MSLLIIQNSKFKTQNSTAGLTAEGGLLRLEALARYPGLLHAVAPRCAPDGADWNLSSKRGTPDAPPSIETALRNREKLAHALGISPLQMVSCRQVHGTDVVVVGPGDGGLGIYPERGATPDADAMVTAAPGVYLMALSADCPPVFLYDPARRVVALAHSGWKGTVARIAANVVARMRDEFGSDPSDLVAVVGPGIGPCCYKVGDNVVEAALASFDAGAWLPQQGGDESVLTKRNGESYFDLGEAIRLTLLDAGLRADRVSVTHACTAHNLDLFYSHRAEAGLCGLFGAVLGLREPSSE